MPLLKSLFFHSTELSSVSFYPLGERRLYADAIRTLGEIIRNKPLEELDIDANVEDEKSHHNKWQEQTLFFHMGDFFPQTLQSLEVRDSYMLPQPVLFEGRDQLVELVLQRALLDKNLLLQKIPSMKKLKKLTIVDCFSYKQASRPVFCEESKPFSMTLREWCSFLPPYVEFVDFSGNRICGIGGEISEITLPPSLVKLTLKDCINNGQVLLALGSKAADVEDLNVSSQVYKRNSALTTQHIKAFLAQSRPRIRHLALRYSHIPLEEVCETIGIHCCSVFLQVAHLSSLDIGAFAQEGMNEFTKNVLYNLIKWSGVELLGLFRGVP